MPLENLETSGMPAPKISIEPLDRSAPGPLNPVSAVFPSLSLTGLQDSFPSPSTKTSQKAFALVLQLTQQLGFEPFAQLRQAIGNDDLAAQVFLYGVGQVVDEIHSAQDLFKKDLLIRGLKTARDRMQADLELVFGPDHPDGSSFSHIYGETKWVLNRAKFSSIGSNTQSAESTA